MPATAASQVAIAPNILLDGRLALFHESEKWLAVADLHFGYELSQRAAGRLMPLWGMTSIEERLTALLDEYRPLQLIIAGDLVPDSASAAAAVELLARLRKRCAVIALAGNHDRHVGRGLQPQESINLGRSRAARQPNEGAHGGNRVSPVKRASGAKRRCEVEPTGLEPVTFWLPARRSPS